MKKLILLAVLLCVTSIIIQADDQERKYAFLDKYFEDPYSTINISDIGFNGEVFGRLPVASISDILVYSDRIEWNDPGFEDRADLVIPVRFKTTSTGEWQKFRLIFHNTAQLHEVPLGGNNGSATRLQHWNPEIEMIPAPDLPFSTTITPRQTFTADLNGDGLGDRVTVVADVGSLSEIKKGIFVKLKDVKLNFGFELVPEEKVAEGVRDARIGYIASYAQTLFQGISDTSSPNINVNNLNAVGASNTLSERESQMLDKAERKIFKPSNARLLTESRQLNANARNAVVVAKPDLTVSNALPQPSPSPDSNLIAMITAHPEVDFDIIRRGNSNPSAPQSYAPDLLLYRAGISRGQRKAETLAKTFQAAKSSFNFYINAAEPLRQLTINSSKEERDAIAADFVSRMKTAESNGNVTKIYSTYKAAWELVLNSPTLKPRRVDANFNEIPINPTGNAQPGEEFKALLKRMDNEWITSIPANNQYVINSGRVAGMSLAFLNLMVMRSNDSYVSDMKNLQKAGQYVTESALQTSQMTMPLTLLAEQSDFSKVSGADFVMSAISSGYRDLPGLIANDHASILFVEGYKQGQEDALKVFKTVLGNQIPQLANATTVLEVATAISQFVKSQQLVIDRLNKFVDSLQKTIDNLNNLLETANETVKQLQDTNKALKEALEKAGNAADAIGDLAHAGTGFLIGGPVGAAACFFFC